MWHSSGGAAESPDATCLDTDERESNRNTETNAHAFANTFAFSRSAK
jgi:hypothetical protein